MLQIIYILLYCVVSAASFILMHHVATTLPVLVATFVAVTTCLLWFNIMQGRHIISLYKKAMQFKMAWLALNIASFFTFYGAFWAMQYLSPLTYITLLAGMMPLGTLLLSPTIEKTHMTWSSYLSGISVFLASILLAFAEWSNAATTLSMQLIAMATVLICSICGSYYLILSKKLQTYYKLHSGEVLALRFHLLMLAGLLFIGKDVRVLNLDTTLLLIMTGFVVTIIPLYLLHQSINKIGAIYTAYVIPLLPVTTYILSFFYYGFAEKSNLAVISALSLFTLAMLYTMRTASKVKRMQCTKANSDLDPLSQSG